MKKLTGLKRSLSSLENKKLKNLKSIVGGRYKIQSNISVNGSVEYDVYEYNGGPYIGRETWFNEDVN
ncbi:putative peptide modification target, TIGR04139 family [Chryseobacterium arachidis]|uniref:Putative peptide modification target, TIGR04139 family n=1 Tax=Chryseobacterium arachidis TaxID=1416778 RepID=A0A1M5CRT1_9FLAO|nr:TIGR04139 family peptide modification target [Chryseobacterium arachidis]SHF57440.1 putative peptide modification target, TIGR04139 family [Chryseobacterium arachidis]